MFLNSLPINKFLEENTICESIVLMKTQTKMCNFSF